jgi:hypothetical protein
MTKDIRQAQMRVSTCYHCPNSSFWGSDGWTCALGATIIWKQVEEKVAEDCPLPKEK